MTTLPSSEAVANNGYFLWKLTCLTALLWCLSREKKAKKKGFEIISNDLLESFIRLSR